MSDHNAFERPAVFLLESIGKRLWGFKPNFMAHFVRQKGPVQSVSWFAGTMPRYERILKDWGPLRTHLIAAAISTLNGCRYNTEGHIRAFQLHYLQIHNRLFPIDDETFYSLTILSPDEMIESLVEVLIAADLASETGPLRRAFELYVYPEKAIGHRDERMIHLIDMFADLNECSIKAGPKIDEVHDPINRDLALQDRYFALRGV